MSLRDVKDDATRHVELTETKLPILISLSPVLFGPGGSLKSFLALNAAGELSKRGYRGLFVDWPGG